MHVRSTESLRYHHYSHLNLRFRGWCLQRHTRRQALTGILPVTDKQSLRKHIRQQRHRLDQRERHHCAIKVAHNLSRLSLFRNADRIACYLPNDGELDLSDVIKHIWHMRKRCYLPILDHLSNNRLWFAPYTPTTPLGSNCYRIPEPDISPRYFARAHSLDLVLMPLVAFDESGNRLGMGGGYYDRTLSFLHHRTRWRRPKLLGIAYDFQKQDKLPAENWDIPLDGIITEKKYYPVTR